ncbi:MAG: DAK2 domain-containing protein [Candidatus Poribacteria bacterium]
MAILYCDGKRFKQAMISGADWLNRRKDQLNRLNVFPVPDGDTGTNMSLTLSSAIREVEKLQDFSLKAVVEASAWGALIGARGNSGIILAQIFAGFAEGIGSSPRIYSQDIAESFLIATEKAYQAVINPVEGTMLTVIRETAEIASKLANKEKDIARLLEAMLERANISLQNTPQLLPILRQAGVVDAGGLGFVSLLEGMLKLIRGEELKGEFGIQNAEFEIKGIQIEDLPTYNIQYDWTNRYCTEFILEGDGLSLVDIKKNLAQFGDSLFVVGDDKLLRVHIHTSDSQQLLHCVSSFGEISQIKVDDMKEEHETLFASPSQSISILPVALGDGLREIFRSMGADDVIEGGQTMNPSMGEILQAIEQASSSAVILLPNNGNVIPAANQAAKLSRKEVVVIPSKSVPEGLSALLAFREDVSLEENVRCMKDALHQAKTGEVTRASRDAKYNDIQIKEGDILGIFDGGIQFAGKSLRDATIALLQNMVEMEDEIITIFYGKDISEGEVEDLESLVSQRFPDKELEIHYGGQPHYFYIISVE